MKQTTTTCKNCGQNFEGNYCNNCGQSAETHKMNFHFLWHDIQHGLFHFDSGIVYTVRQLFTRPGSAIREFMEGKRVKHSKPFSFVIILATLYAFLFHYFHIELPLDIHVSGNEAAGNYIKVVNEWIIAHYAIVSLSTIPLAALASFLAFRKTGYNYFEHIVLNSFINGQRLAIRILLFPLLVLFNHSTHLVTMISIADVAGIIFSFWTYWGFFNTLGRGRRVWRILLSQILWWLFYIALVLIFSIVFNLLIENHKI